MIESYLRTRDSIHIFGDHNARFGDLNEMFSMSYNANVDAHKNKNGETLSIL